MTIHRTEYTSGLRVVTERMPGVRSVSLGVWVLAGSRDEAPAISGSSHFLEHLLFKGTKTRSAQDIARGVRRRRRRPERVHREGVHVLLRARARPRPATRGRPSRRHAAALGDPFGGPRRRAAGDPRGDQHARGLARGPRARRLHRDALARPPARPPGPRHGRHDRGRHPRLGATASTGGTTSPGTSWSRRPATSGTRTCSRSSPARDGHRARAAGGRRLDVEPAERRPRRPIPSGDALVQPPQDRAGAHLPGHQRPGAHGSRPVRVPAS